MGFVGELKSTWPEIVVPVTLGAVGAGVLEVVWGWPLWAALFACTLTASAMGVATARLSRASVYGRLWRLRWWPKRWTRVHVSRWGMVWAGGALALWLAQIAALLFVR